MLVLQKGDGRGAGNWWSTVQLQRARARMVQCLLNHPVRHLFYREDEGLRAEGSYFYLRGPSLSCCNVSITCGDRCFQGLKHTEETRANTDCELALSAVEVISVMPDAKVHIIARIEEGCFFVVSVSHR